MKEYKSQKPNTMTETEKLKELSEETLAKIISGNAKSYEHEYLIDVLEKAFKSYKDHYINSISDEMSDIQKIRKNPYSEDDLVTAFNVGWEQCRKSAKQKLLNK